MPRIDTYTANTKPAVPNQPLRFLETGEFSGAAALQQTAQLSERWGIILGTLRQQQADLEFTQMRGLREAGISAITLRLDNDPTLRDEPWKYESKFTEEVVNLDTALAKTSKLDIARNAYMNYANMNLPKEIVAARARGMKLWQVENVAKLNEAEDRSADLAAATLSDPAQYVTNKDGEQVHKEVGRYHDLVDRAYAMNTIDAKDKEKRYRDFETKVLTRNMDFLARTNPEELSRLQLGGLYDKLDVNIQEKYLAQGRALLEKRDAQTKKVMDDVDKFVWESAVSQVELGTLDPEYFAAIQTNENPFIPPSKARTLREIAANAGMDNSGIAAFREEFRRGSFSDPNVTMERVADMRASVNAYVDMGGVGGKAYSDFLKELESAEIQAGAEIRTLKAGVKSDVSFAQAREHEKFKSAEELYDSKVEAMSPITRSLFPNMKPQDMGKVNQLIRKGVKPEDAVNEILGNRLKSFDMNKTQKQKDLDNLLKGQR